MDIPAFKSMAKSPTTWGNSWHRTANAVDRPEVIVSEKAAPMANPSARL